MSKSLILLGIFLFLNWNSSWGTEILVQKTRGGFPEYCFVKKLSVKEVPYMAETLALAIIKGRKIVFRNLAEINSPKPGPKNFTPDYFEKSLREAMASRIHSLTPKQKEIWEDFIYAAKLAVAINQERINLEGVGFKYFLPAVWARQTAFIFQAKTGIVIKQAALKYRHPVNRPDETEIQAILSIERRGLSDFSRWDYFGKQRVFRYFKPIKNKAFCAKCHGEPRGAKDPLGFEKEGFKKGEIRAVISVTLPVEG